MISPGGFSPSTDLVAGGAYHVVGHRAQRVIRQFLNFVLPISPYTGEETPPPSSWVWLEAVMLGNHEQINLIWFLK